MAGTWQNTKDVTQPPLLPDWQHWECTPIPNGPKTAQFVLRGLAIDHTEEAWDFRDRYARPVQIPRTKTGTRHTKDGDSDVTAVACPTAYAQACWDLTQGCLLLDEQGTHLYRRRVDRLGRKDAGLGWERVESIADTYGANRTEADPAWDAQLKVEAAKITTDWTVDGTPRRVRRGIMFSDRVYCRIGGRLHVITSADKAWPAACRQAWILTIPCEWDERLADEAESLLELVTDGDGSRDNLMRMFATPMLEEYKHLTYVVYGHGGNGKSLILGSLVRSFPESAVSVDAGSLLHGKGFDRQQEAHRLIGRLWAYDDDADDITLHDMTELKKISTGGAISGRLIGRNSVSFTPECTMAIATNGSFVTDASQASMRRYVLVRMADGLAHDDFLPLVAHIREHGCLGFLMASCRMWQACGDEPDRDVTIGDVNDISDEEQEIVDAVCQDGGFAPVSVLGKLRSERERKEALARLGLARIGAHRLSGSVTKCIGVADEAKFAPFREAWQEAQRMAEAAEAEEASKRVPVPLPDGGDAPAPDAAPDSYGFACDFVPARPDKVAVGWKTLVESPNADTTKRPDSAVYAVVPAPGYCVIDLDRGKQGEADGWTVIQREVGSYGGERLPRTYLVGTPSGGAHLYYRIPDAMCGHLKDAVHAQGIPVDMRAELKGYVIGAGSVTDAGRYTLLDVPPDGEAVPDLTPQLCQWLVAHGYTDMPTAASGGGIAGMQAFKTATRTAAGTGKGGTWRADMTPIPEGQRNSTLYKWAFGRLYHHPDNAQQIEADTRERGRDSGLPDSEVDTIWRSVVRSVSEAGS